MYNKKKILIKKKFRSTDKKYIQGVSEICVLILTSGRTRQFMTLFSITFCKISKSFHRRVYI
jgi:DNA-binding Xre family transcriptional regulator